MTDHAKRLAEIDARIAEQANEETCSTSIVSSWAHDDRGWLREQIHAASEALDAAGIRDDGRTLAERVEHLSHANRCLIKKAQDRTRAHVDDMREIAAALDAAGAPPGSLVERVRGLAEETVRLRADNEAQRFRAVEAEAAAFEAGEAAEVPAGRCPDCGAISALRIEHHYGCGDTAPPEPDIEPAAGDEPGAL